MIIETKFRVGDFVWMIRNNRADSGFVATISVVHGYGAYSPRITYFVEWHGAAETHDERELFASKEELLKSL
jgi:hypothetical protein